MCNRFSIYVTFANIIVDRAERKFATDFQFDRSCEQFHSLALYRNMGVNLVSTLSGVEECKLTTLRDLAMWSRIKKLKVLVFIWRSL
jgi:hypothetical protein